MFDRSEYFLAEGTKGSADALINYIDSTLLPGRDPDIRAFLQHNSRSVLLMLDGLDEIPDADKNREFMRNTIIDLVEKYPYCRFVITSRPYAYNDPAWRLDQYGFYDVMLSEFNDVQVEDFISHWYQCLEEYGRVDSDLQIERTRNLINRIKQSDYLKQLSTNPLLLTMLAAVNERSAGTLPIDRSELYDENIKLLLDRWNHQRGLNTPILSNDLGVGAQDIREKLEQLAFEVHCEQGGKENIADVTYDRLFDALSSITTTHQPKFQVEMLMDYLHQRSGILVADSPKMFRFPHRSFQEFMAACYLIRQHDYPDSIVKYVLASPGTWRNVLMFAAWRAVNYRHRDVWELIAELCPDSVPSNNIVNIDWWGAILAGQVLLETNLHKQDIPRRYRNLVSRIRDWLVTCIELGAISKFEKVEIGRILGSIGDFRPGVGLAKNNLPNINWIKIPPGAFSMGSSETDDLALENEKPQRVIELGPYAISKYPITVDQFRAYIEGSDYQLNRDAKIEIYENPKLVGNTPIVGVSWSEATGFCKWLSKKLGYEIRLPTEEEWEKAARGTDGRIYPWGNDFDVDRCNAVNTLKDVCAVGLFPEGASPYGVFDMSGNIWEWCVSNWDVNLGAPTDVGVFHMLRGGSFDASKEAIRCAYRGKEPTNLTLTHGFRIVTSHTLDGQ
jgi:formylglycine-generating enzyme required for sulfatase activity